MVLKDSRITEISNNSTYSLILLYFTLLIFCIITIYFYVGNPLNLFDFLGFQTIVFSILIIFLILSPIVFYTIYYDKDDIYYKSKNLFSIFFLTSSKILYFFILSLFFFYLFKKSFDYVYKSSDIVNSIINLFYIIIILSLLYLSYSYFINKNISNLNLNEIITILSAIINYIPCLIDNSIDYLKKNEFNKQNLYYIFALGIFFFILFIGYIIPKIFIYVLLYDGKQILNYPVYLNNSTYLTNYKDLNEDIIEGNIFKYLSQKIYSTYENSNESFINLSDPQLNYEVNKNIQDIQDNLDPKQLNNAIKNNPELLESINQIKDNPDFLKDKLLSLIVNDTDVNSIYNDILSNNIITTNKSINEVISPVMNNNYNNKKLFNYNYCLSSWVFIDNYTGNNNNNNENNNDKSILKFGNKLNLLYNPIKKELFIKIKSCIKDENNDELNNDNCKTKIAFRTNNILYQRWNHILINYDSGTLDVFINNRLVSSTPNISPIYIEDNLTIGDNNGVDGAICNIMYFSNVLNKNKINNLYKYFYASTPPII